MKRLLVVGLLLLSACSDEAQPPPAIAQAPTAPTPAVVAEPEPSSVAGPDGKQIYEQICLPCHAAGGGHAGTMRLGERLGIDKSVLLERDDLQPDYVKTIVRYGLQMMPPFRPSELTEAELDALAQYVATQKAG